MTKPVAKLVFIPTPGLGHIISTVEIARLLANRDRNLSITVLVIKPPRSAPGSAITTYIESLAKTAMDRISFIELPQDETLPVHDPKAPMVFFIEFIKSHCKYVRNIVADMMSKSKPGGFRVAGFVIDMFCTAMIDVANEFNVPSYVFFTSSAGFLGFELYIQKVSDDEKKDVVELSNLDTEVTVPGFENPVPTKMFPNGVKNRDGLAFLLSSARRLREVRGIMVNTFLELETRAIGSLSADSPPVYPVGPVLNLEGVVDDDVIGWLDNQPDSSVVFLCFGSMGSFDEIQVKEIAYALEQSGQRFVWSLRRRPSDNTSRVTTDYEDPGAVLPNGFLKRTSGIGKVIGWAPQTALLAHRAVGGFVSHCGWNSLLESLWFGVPVATWPIRAEQQINAFEIVVELGLGVEIKADTDTGFVTSAEIASGISRVMEDNEVRAKAKEISEKSRLAVMEGGSSYTSVDRLVQDFFK